MFVAYNDRLSQNSVLSSSFEPTNYICKYSFFSWCPNFRLVSWPLPLSVPVSRDEFRRMFHSRTKNAGRKRP